MFIIDDVLSLAVQLEQNGERVYRRALDVIQEKSVAELVSWMAEEEKRHAQWFSDLKTKWAADSENPFTQDIGQSMLSDMLGRQSFSLKEVDFGAITDEQELLAVFIEFEEDTILFYQMLVPFIQEDAVKDRLALIIDEEREHIRRISSHLQRMNTGTVSL
jgi:rubrerythrin